MTVQTKMFFRDIVVVALGMIIAIPIGALLAQLFHVI